MAFLDENGLSYYHGKIDNIFAHKDGSYSSLTAGNAEQLVSTVGVNDKTPYLFRTTGGSADVGDRVKLSEITGGTVAINQMLHELNSTNWGAESGVTASYADGVVTISSTTANNGIYDKVYLSIVDGHKYLVNFESKCAAGVRAGISVASSTIGDNHTQVADAWERTCSIKSNSVTSANRRCYLLGRDGTYSDIQIRNAYIIDLTAMFGSTIADYLYTLESGTAGAGVAKLKSWGFCTKPYYAYDAGSLLSVKTSAHKEIGFNQWDEQWEPYFSSQIKSKNKIPVIAGATYYCKCPSAGVVAYFYTDLTSSAVGSATCSNRTFTIPNNVHYMNIYAGAGYGTTYNHDICINLHWDGEKDGEYAPYSENTYPLDDVELRGIPKLDASNNLYYDGDGYAPDGTVTRKCATRAYEAGDATDGSTMITDGTNTVYKLDTPTTESADPYQEVQICSDWGTEEFVDSRAVPMPVGSESFYQLNLRAKLEMAPNSPSGDGDWLVRQTDGINEYVALSDNSTVSGLVTRCPACPTDTDGTFKLTATVSGGSVTYSWVSA